MLSRKQIFELYLDKLYEKDRIGVGVFDVSLECEIALLEHILGVDEIPKLRSEAAEVNKEGAPQVAQQSGDQDES